MRKRGISTRQRDRARTRSRWMRARCAFDPPFVAPIQTGANPLFKSFISGFRRAEMLDPASSSADPATRLSRFPPILKAGGPVSGSSGLVSFLTRHGHQHSLCPLPKPRKPSSASLGLTDFSPFEILVSWYKSIVHVGVKRVLVSPNRCDRIVS